MFRYLSSGLFLAVLTLMGIGLVQVYSSSYIHAIETVGDGLFYFKKQLIFSGVALIGILLIAHLPLRLLKKYGVLLWMFGAFLMALTFIPGIGVRAGGAARWIQLPLGFRFEPSEFLKLVFVIFCASLTVRDEIWMGRIKWGWVGILLLIPFLMLLKQPDFGSLVIMVAVGTGILFASGMAWKYLLSAVAIATPIFYFAVMSVPYRKARLMAFLDPWSDPQRSGFQSLQSMLSFNSGGFWGVGLGKGQGKLFFLPEAHTDFTMAVLGEEVGFMGLMLVLALYGYLVYKGFQIASRAESSFSRYVALGISLNFALSVFINVGVAMGLLPTKGLTMPFLSYGGSSLVIQALMFGILVGIENQIESNRIENRLQRLHRKWPLRR